MRIILILILIITVALLKAQYPFEKYPAMDYSKRCNWKASEKQNKISLTNSIPDFFDKKEDIKLHIITYSDKGTSLIRIFKNQKQIQEFKEPFAIKRQFDYLYDTLYYGDINGDSLIDLKILCWYGGCGLASLNMRVIYLFQQPGEKFIKISYLNKGKSSCSERDFDGDGNYEIITMELNRFEKHNYWTFNLYNFINGDLVCVNDKFDYPIMIQYLNKENYTITDKISKNQIKSFSKDKPHNYDKK
ncbi:MAG: hypothetical protein KA792_06270 [Bacteroidales bacterium]|nr:hypothetical protein [Bacteroidales bacterium]